MSGAKKLAGKVALITGAGRGIGSTIAETLATEGATVLLVARSQAELRQTAEACREAGASSVEVHQTDLTDSAAIDSLCKQLLQKYGCIDVLVNSAGLGSRGQVGGQTPLDGDADVWQMMVQLNLLAPMRLTRHLAPAMTAKKSGLIINLGSIAGVQPMPASCTYSASKFGLRGWSLSCCDALRSHNIKVVLINPGFVNTTMVNTRPDLVPERLIQPSDVAEAVMLAEGCLQLVAYARSPLTVHGIFRNATKAQQQRVCSFEKEFARLARKGMNAPAVCSGRSPQQAGELAR